MGYDSNFQIRIYKYKSFEEAKQVVDDIEKESGHTMSEKDYDSCSLNEAHWYDWEKDLKKVSKKYPDVVIEADREGEDRNDNQRARFHDGKSEILGMIYSFPDFEEIPDEMLD